MGLVSIRCIESRYRHDRLAFLERLMLWSQASGCKILTAQKESNSIRVAMGGAVDSAVDVVPQARQSGFAVRRKKAGDGDFRSQGWSVLTTDKTCNGNEKTTKERGGTEEHKRKTR